MLTMEQYARIQGWTYLGIDAAGGAHFRFPDGKHGCFVSGTLPRGVRVRQTEPVYRADDDPAIRASEAATGLARIGVDAVERAHRFEVALERIRSEAAFMAAGGRAIDPERIVRACDSALGREAAEVGR